MVEYILLPKLTPEFLLALPIIFKVGNMISCFHEWIFVGIQILFFLSFCVF